MKKLTILASPINAVGHVNACSGALKAFLNRGHRIIFVIEEAFKGKIAAQGFEEFLYKIEKSNNEKNPGEAFSKVLVEAKVLGDYNVWEKMENLASIYHWQGEQYFQELVMLNGTVEKAIDKFKPDLLYWDGGCLFPAIYYSGIPWVRNVSIMPIWYLFVEKNEVPPGGSGFPFDGPFDKKYQEFNKIRQELLISKTYSKNVHKLGYEPFPGDYICPETQILTIYGFPKELNYPYMKTLNWFNLEVFHKVQAKVVELKTLVSSEFLSDNLDGRFSGKLIYVSMGSMGSIDLKLMNGLVQVLGKTNHKYIVSKGPRHSEYELPNNMYGDRYLPQTSIIPHVDLVITHGGNNTVTETFAQGKPMIVLPLFADQFDNAQRMHETGYGIRVEPYKFTESELINAIDKLTNDQKLKKKLGKASKRIQALNRHEELVDRIEGLMANEDSSN